MDRVDENRRYKWSTSATRLLVSIWSHDMVQNRLKLGSRNQPIWESIARFMNRKGFNVSGLQCRTRIKNMLCSYYEAVRKKDRRCIGPYFDLFNKVVSNRNVEKKGSNKKLSIQSQPLEDIEGDSGDGDVVLDSPLDTGDNQITSDFSSNVEFLNVQNQAVQVNTPVIDNEFFSRLEMIITKVVNTHTNLISQVINHQSDIIQKLLVSEREKYEALLLAEKKSRKQMEEKINRLMTSLGQVQVP